MLCQLALRFTLIKNEISLAGNGAQWLKECVQALLAVGDAQLHLVQIKHSGHLYKAAL